MTTDVPYTPAWQEQITGVSRDHVISVARAFAGNAEKTNGKSMVILGAGLNHWYHMDMIYRSIINMLVMCGCVGQSGGGWSHYVGQEKLRPQTGWTTAGLRAGLGAAAAAHELDQLLVRPHRPVALRAAVRLRHPLADRAGGRLGLAEPDRLQRPCGADGLAALGPAARTATRWRWREDAEAAGQEPADYVVEQLKSGDLAFACEDPDAPENWPRNLFVWRSNLLGSSGKGHEYFLKHLLGTEHGVQGKDLGEEGGRSRQEVVWHDEAPEGKLDLLVTLDFRMSTTCLYSDVVLPTATWYEKNDLNTSDMHPFIHPLSDGRGPGVGVAHRLGDLQVDRQEVLRDRAGGTWAGDRTSSPLTPMQHDSPGELAQPFDVSDWKKGECEPVPGKTMPMIKVIERDYPNVYKRFTALGPLMENARQRRQGHRLEHRARGRLPAPAERHGEGRRPDQGHAPDRKRYRRLRGDLRPRARDQRRSRGQGVGLARQADRARAHPPRQCAGGGQDPLPRHPGPAAQDRLLADLVRPGERARQLQRRLHQRP
ncbi:MAG: molybdopterin-dependent oxidoreductase [Rhodovibrio sp.]|nr:molybdopterin-dependent oxidoreductase [Rhodovibrio sp.]